MPKTSVEILMVEIDHLKSGLERLEKLMEAHMLREEAVMEKQSKSLEAMVSKLDEKYAAKWTEGVVKFVLAGVGGAVLTALMALVITK